MADTLTDIQGDIINKTKAEVEALIGTPLKKSFWKNARLPEGATAEETAAFEAEQLDEIWIYANGRVTFTLAGKATKVDDNVSKYFPPDQPGPLIA
jgi:hypothetical protein